VEEGVGKVFFLIEMLVKAMIWLLVLPFKLAWELLELVAHSSHHSRRRRHPARRR
jgi:hypothetical protein